MMKKSLRDKVLKHLGPGNHPSGSPQSVHGRGADAPLWEFPRNPRRDVDAKILLDTLIHGELADRHAQRLYKLWEAGRTDAFIDLARQLVDDRQTSEAARSKIKSWISNNLVGTQKQKHDYHTAKMERCLQHLKDKGFDAESSHRICYDSILGADHKANKSLRARVYHPLFKDD